MTPCPECDATGTTIAPDSHDYATCWACSGTGEVDPVEYDADVLLREIQRDDWAEWDWHARDCGADNGGRP